MAVSISGLAVVPNGSGAAVGIYASGELVNRAYWGVWSTIAFLPNAASNLATGSAFTALRQGDTAYVDATTSMYVCTAKGTSGGGDATWVQLAASAGTSVTSVFTRSGDVTAVSGDYTGALITFTPDGDIAATTVQTAIVEVRDDTDTKLTSKLDSSHAGTGGATHANVVAAGSSGFMTGADKTKLDGVEISATADQIASEVPFTPVGTIAATNVQAAIEEVAAEAGASITLSDSAPAVTGTTDPGVSTEVSRSDHVHAHGTQAGGTSHALVIASGASGFISGTDKTKLDGIAASAQVNTVDSVFTRTGAVVAVAGDYTATQLTFTANGDIAATNAQAAITEVRDDTDTKLIGKLGTAHEGAGGSVHANVIAAGAAGFMTGADKTKLDGIDTGAQVNTVTSVFTRSGAIVAVAGDYTATQITFTPNGDIASTTTQAAIVEVRDDTDTKLTGKLSTAHEGVGGAAHANVIAAGAAGFMTGADKTKLDGIASGATVNTLSSTTPEGLAATGTVGVGTTVARADHVHAHGNQLGGQQHAPVAPAGDAGFMTGDDKTKLDGIDTGATNGLTPATVTGTTDTLSSSTDNTLRTYTANNDGADVTITVNSGTAGHYCVLNRSGTAALILSEGTATLVFPGGTNYTINQYASALMVWRTTTEVLILPHDYRTIGVWKDAPSVENSAKTTDLKSLVFTGGAVDTVVNSAGQVTATFTAFASLAPFTPNGSIAATNVQDAIVEVRDEAAPVETIVTEAGATRTMANADAGRTVRCTAGCVVTIPSALTPGVTCTFVAEHATGQVTFVGSSLTVRFAAAFTAGTAQQWSVAVVRILDTDEALLTGDLALV